MLLIIPFTIAGQIIAPNITKLYTLKKYHSLFKVMNPAQQNRPTTRAPDLWGRHVFQALFLSVEYSDQIALSNPTHRPVTLTISLHFH